MFLKPRTIRKGEGIGKSDVALKRINYLEEPQEYYLAYIDDGECLVANADYQHHTTFTNRYSVGPAIDCAIEFDCKWIPVEDKDVYEMVTIGEPFVFKVTPGGALIVQQGRDGSPFELCGGSVTDVSAIRGWRNVIEETSDQGLICAYIKNDKKVYYRTYATQGDGRVLWEPEVLIDVFELPVNSLNLFRTNDYRTGFLAESNGQIIWAITNRNWAGMGVKDENIKVNSSIGLEFTHVTYSHRETEENIKVNSSLGIELIYASRERIFTSVENTSSTRILAFLDNTVKDDLRPTDFTLEDDYGLTFAVDKAVLLNPNCIELTVSLLDFANQPTEGEGSLTLTCLGKETKNLIDETVNIFSKRFSPTGLTFKKLEPPTVVLAFNEEVNRSGER